MKVNKIIQLVVESISENYDINIERAESIVVNSFFPKIFEQMPEYVQHYDAEYWADEIMKDKERE